MASCPSGYAYAQQIFYVLSKCTWVAKYTRCFINTKKAFKKLYMFYFETFRIILNPSSVKK